jgi:putative transcriptional regulator
LNYDRTIRQIPEGRPIDALIAAYAAKTLALPQAALVAAHLELKPDNRAYVAALEAVHGVFLEELKPVPLAGRDRRLVNIFASASPGPAPVTSARGASDPAAVLPRALRRLVGCDYADLSWRSQGADLREVLLPDDSCGGARLVGVPPGHRLPIARDDAVAGLVLAGGASDRDSDYARGDIIFAAPDRDSAPTAEGNVECVCFIVAEAPAKSPGPLSRVLHLVMGG